MRLQKYLATQGIDSRRKCEEHIKNGRVRVNDEIITDMGFKVDPNVDLILFDNKQVQVEEEKIYIMINKPRNYVSTVKDNFSRKTVLDLIKIKSRVYPVGRLDYDTQGLLLLTNDGDFTYSLTHPKHHINKTYIAKVKGRPTKMEISKFENGLVIDDYKTSKASFKIIREDRDNTLVEIIIWEGRNRQIRKMCEEIGHPVITLTRISIGQLHLGDLQVGKFRYLTDKEINLLR
ncbi:pseudouridine synthase [Alkalibaculum sp. M08DMB]|uniref:Pseudouridine synthase n=2 Tax=Alkalibaculum sporogenes TaxID=2655001 RepID=A0A6A7K792_9FIRM|nr:pseudouridine synthase [Alkalibaculum sporogenes]MPW25201.1 pseudouridine synthase [Alkalibaculum sporogenes]